MDIHESHFPFTVKNQSDYTDSKGWLTPSTTHPWLIVSAMGGVAALAYTEKWADEICKSMNNSQPQPGSTTVKENPMSGVLSITPEQECFALLSRAAAMLSTSVKNPAIINQELKRLLISTDEDIPSVNALCKFVREYHALYS